MSEKPSLPPLPPLSLEALLELGRIEEIVQDELLDCDDNPEKTNRILRTGVAESLTFLMDYYSSLPNYQPLWIIELIPKTINSLIALCPPFTSGEQVRRDLFLTAIHYLARRGRATENETEKAASRKPAPVPSEQDSTPVVHASVEQSVNANTNEEIERRRALLNEYKAATKNPSNKRIYGARNSRIHKPEFYEWVNGTLPRDSATTANFERFLREKKPPIPKNPKG
jgi:hypothetical protein